MEPNDLEALGRLALAACFGGLIGLERETHSQPAGLRTHMIVSLGACLMMLVSMHVAGLNPVHADPGRIAAQVIAGIGFLGAGAIMRFGMSVKGLTTAASLWTAAGIGLAIGCGYWKAGGVATLFTLVALFIFDKIEKTFIKGKSFRRFVVHAKDAAGLVGRIEEAMEKAGIGIKEVDIQRDLVEKKLQITVVATCPGNADVDVLSSAISAFAEVEKVEID